MDTVTYFVRGVKIHRYVLWALWLSGPIDVSHAQDASSSIEAVHVQGAIYMLTVRAEFRMNLAVSVGPDGVLLVDHIDDPVPADSIRAVFAKLGSSSVRYILNTHWHPDHTGGNTVYAPGAVVVAHANVRKRVMEPQHPSWAPERIAPLPRHAWPVITFTTDLTIHFNGEPVEIIAVAPAHTDGDAVVYFSESNVAVIGDVFHGRGRFSYPSLDTGGDVHGLAAGLAKVIERLPNDVVIITGHGEQATLEDLRDYHALLVETTAMVQQKIEAGQDMERIKTEGLAPHWRSWNNGYQPDALWLEYIYRDLTRGAEDNKKQN